MNSYRKYGIALLAGVLLVAGWAGNALALTDACTEISNRAFLDYKVGGVDQPQVGSTDGEADADETTDFSVATKVDLTVAGAVTTVVPGASDRVITYSVTNTGNDIQRYSLRLLAAANGENGGTAYTDNFNATNIRVYYDTDATYNGGAAQTQIGGGPVTPNGAHIDYTPNVTGNNGIIYVHVVADIPNTQLDGDDALYALQAVTHQRTTLNGDDGSGGTTAGGETTEGAQTTNGCGNVVVLADGDSDGGDDFTGIPGTLSDGPLNGDGYAVGVYTVSTATISMAKSYAVIWDPVNTAPPYKPIPGARIEYTMTITNSSTTTGATGLSLVDMIPANTDFYGGSIVMPGGALADYSTTAPPGPPVWGTAAPGVGVIASAITYIKVDTFDLAASSTAVVKFTVVIE